MGIQLIRSIQSKRVYLKLKKNQGKELYLYMEGKNEKT